jgi:hypothetical protein
MSCIWDKKRLDDFEQVEGEYTCNDMYVNKGRGITLERVRWRINICNTPRFQLELAMKSGSELLLLLMR